MVRSAAVLLALTCSVGLGMAACGDSAAPPPERTPLPAPDVTLTADEQKVWAPLPADRSEIPVLLYHGIGPAEDFSDGTDADYGVDVDAFAKQMTMIHHAGYRTVGLGTFVDFVEGKPVDLPARPLLLTFDDARANSWTGADGILRELGLHAVMFVDVGRVDAGEPEYLTWRELQTMRHSGRWELQLHSGKGHVHIQHGSEPDQTGPFYAYKKHGESFDDWRERVSADIEWGQRTLADHDRAYRPLAFAPPYGAYGQDGTNDSRIPDELLGWLTGRFPVVFTQDENALAKPGSRQPLGRIQVTRAVTGGDLRARLQSGTP